ncbi:MAG: hypothetical protein V4712_17715 [Pseudomonadota bacterium]
MPSLQAESATVICQRALGLAEHRNTFESLEDTSQLAREARLRYDMRRRTVLEAMDWRFARRRAIAQAVTAAATPADLPRAWTVPPECLRIRGVFDGCRLLRHSREEVLFTQDAAIVQIVYTADFHNPALFPPVFTQALEFLLASEFSMLYARSANRSEMMLANFRRTMDEADAIEAAERSEEPAYADGGWVDSIAFPWSRGLD